VRFLLSFVGALIVGAVASYVASILGLVARRLRNNALFKRGRPPYRDVAFNREVVIANALLCAIVGAVLAWWMVPLRAILIGGLVAPALLLVQQITTAALQARS
jgi:hypothetical protein